MNKELSSYIITLGMFASILILVDIGLNMMMPTLHPFKFGSILIVFMFLVYVLSHYLMLTISNKQPQNFINLYMGLTGARLMVLSMIILVVFMAFKENRIEAAITVGICYILFSVVEWRFTKGLINPKK